MILRPLTLVGIILSLVTGVSLGVLIHLKFGEQSPNPASSTIAAVLEEVATNYVEDISEEELLQFAIEGMMRGLDEHSDYLDPNAYQSLKSSTTGRFGGIGIELGMVDDYFTVVAPIDDTPAANAGVLAGDRIVGVNGDTAKGMKLTDLIETLRGDPGSIVTLSIKRKDEATKDYELQRAIIEVASVRSRMLAPGYGYLRISQFQTETGKDVAKHLKKLTETASESLSGLVIDLRNNPGGTLQSSVEVADHFLNDGTIVSTSGRHVSSESTYLAKHGDLLDGKPIVIIINGGSASASEIVAAALQDTERATIIGTTSYGKGSVQSVVPLDADQALKLTTAYYYSPLGRTIHNIGVEPDIALELDEEALLDEAVQLLEAAQPNQLQARLNKNL
jgi:carboxyl-terminal processing protease